jgi:putative nucleotidyltransferase with HDIG domain
MNLQAGARASENIRVMVIDDDDTVREVLSEVLTRRGWDVDAYASAESALAAMESKSYDVALADINMPGLSGMDFLQMARESHPEVPVVMITGYPSIDKAVEAMKTGASDFIAKPFKSEELEIIVRKAVGSSKVVSNGVEPRTRARAIGKLPEAARRRLEDKIKELSILHTIAETLDEAAERDEIYKKTMDLAQIITDAERAFILTVEPEKERVVVAAASGYEGALAGLSYAAAEEPFKSVISNRCYSYLIADDNGLSPLVSGGRAPGDRVFMLLSPLVINRDVSAILGLTGMDTGGGLSNDELTLLLNLSAKAALKLENMTLSENIFLSIVGAFKSLINALDARDSYTKDHASRVTNYAIEIARALKCGHDVIDSLSFAGPLHDIGKIAVRDDILLKQGVFSIDEREIMRSHVVRGLEILKPLNLLSVQKAIVLYHHERWDGSGYPNGLSGDDIPLVARIFSVADAFDAMTSSRPYRSALSYEIAREEILRCSGTQFDPVVVEAFLRSAILRH